MSNCLLCNEELGSETTCQYCGWDQQYSPDFEHNPDPKVQFETAWYGSFYWMPSLSSFPIVEDSNKLSEIIQYASNLSRVSGEQIPANYIQLHEGKKFFSEKSISLENEVKSLSFLKKDIESYKQKCDQLKNELQALLPNKLKVREFSRGFENPHISEKFDRWVSGGFLEEISAETYPVPAEIREMVYQGHFRINDNYPPQPEEFALIGKEIGEYAILAVAIRIFDDKERSLIAYRYFWVETLHPKVDKIETLLDWWDSQGRAAFVFKSDRKLDYTAPTRLKDRSVSSELASSEKVNSFVASVRTCPFALERITFGYHELHLLNRSLNESSEVPISWAWNVRNLEKVEDFSLILCADTKSYEAALTETKKFQRVLPVINRTLKDLEGGDTTDTNYQCSSEESGVALLPSRTNDQARIIGSSTHKDSEPKNQLKIVPICEFSSNYELSGGRLGIRGGIRKGYNAASMINPPKKIEIAIQDGEFRLSNDYFRDNNAYAVMGREFGEYALLAVATVEKGPIVAYRYFFLKNPNNTFDGLGSLLKWWRESGEPKFKHGEDTQSNLAYEAELLPEESFRSQQKNLSDSIFAMNKDDKYPVVCYTGKDSSPSQPKDISLISPVDLHIFNLWLRSKNQNIEKSWAWNVKWLDKNAEKNFNVLCCFDKESAQKTLSNIYHNRSSWTPMPAQNSDFSKCLTHQHQKAGQKRFTETGPTNSTWNTSIKTLSDLRGRLLRLSELDSEIKKHRKGLESIQWKLFSTHVLEADFFYRQGTVGPNINKLKVARYKALLVLFLSVPNDPAYAMQQWISSLSKQPSDREIVSSCCTLQDKVYAIVSNENGELSDLMQRNILTGITFLFQEYASTTAGNTGIQNKLINNLFIAGSSTLWKKHLTTYAERFKAELQKMENSDGYDVISNLEKGNPFQSLTNTIIQYKKNRRYQNPSVSLKRLADLFDKMQFSREDKNFELLRQYFSKLG